ncbi:unnamed protein product [Diamesa hyperborea]
MEICLEFLTIALMVGLISDSQTLPITAMVLLRSKIELLCEEFKNLEYYSEQQFDQVITKLVDYHEYLLRIKDLINDAFILPLFLELLTTSLLIATLSFNFSKISFIDNTYEAIILSVAIILYFLQIYMPCYYGNKAATASDNLVFSLYSCSWFDMPVKARKVIIIMMQNSQKTMHFGIAEFFRLTMEQFGRILNSIYSLYTLIRQFQ